ncbi:MFS transporter [Spirillospora sp. NBC_01491]|uniref:MFS transporter n=1 Tax=Spirillospora sp. NBC_01491 TaxID=2976007 RepID=UPI002E34A239|nr:MFS transporter [Spirillospora sp. NBC_01491]
MPLPHRVFLYGQSVSVLGDGLAVLAVPLLVLRLTHDPLAAGLAAAPRGIGHLLVGLPAGPIVDRLDPWAVLIASDVVRAGVFTALPLLAWAAAARLWIVLALAFLAGAATVFFDAALAVAVKDLFPGAGLLRANSLLETAAQISQVAGPALVGVLAAAVGVETALLVNAASFAISLASLAAVARHRPAARAVPAARADPFGVPRVRRGTGRALAAEFAEGVRFVTGFRPLLVLTVVQTLVNLCLAVDTLIVYFAQVTLRLPPPLVGAVLAAGGLGGVTGAMAAPRIAARAGPLPVIAAAVAVVAATLPVMAAVTAWWALAAVNAVQLGAVTLAGVVNRSARQAWVPRHLMGRVTTVVRSLFLAATPLGAAVAGAVAGASGGDPRSAFLGAGLLTAAVIAAGWFGFLRRCAAGLTPEGAGSP